MSGAKSTRLQARFRCASQSEASRPEAAIKKLRAPDKQRLVGKTGVAVRKALLE